MLDRMETLIWLFVTVILIGLFAAVDVSASKREAVNKHENLSNKLSTTGSETTSLKRAKEYYQQLSASYNSIEDFADDSAKACYKDDIASIRSNAEGLAQDAWQSGADKYLKKMEDAYILIMDYSFEDVEKAYKSMTTFLKAYDAYFDWTQKCFDDSRDIWHDINLWDEAKQNLKLILDETDDYIFWGDPSFGSSSVRQQIEANLTKRIEAMRPEYKRKIKLKELMLRRIADADCGTVQRSTFLKSNFDNFLVQEVEACYKGLVKDHNIIEVKQGNRYFACLSDAMAKKYRPQQVNTASKQKSTTQSKQESKVALP